MSNTDDGLDTNPFADVSEETAGPPPWIGIPLGELEGMTNHQVKRAMHRREQLHVFQLVLFGNASVGKTSLYFRKSDNEFHGGACQSTIGVDFVVTPVQIDDVCVKCQIWDTAGQERFRSLLRNYYKKASEGGVVLVYDVGSEKSFDAIDAWLDDLEKHVAIPKNAEGQQRDVPILLIGNKIDIPGTERTVAKETAEKYANDHSLMYHETSAKNGTGVDDAFHKILQALYMRALERGEARSLQNGNQVVSPTAGEASSPEKKSCC